MSCSLILAVRLASRKKKRTAWGDANNPEATSEPSLFEVFMPAMLKGQKGYIYLNGLSRYGCIISHWWMQSALMLVQIEVFLVSFCPFVRLQQFVLKFRSLSRLPSSPSLHTTQDVFQCRSSTTSQTWHFNSNKNQSNYDQCIQTRLLNLPYIHAHPAMIVLYTHKICTPFQNVYFVMFALC